MLRTVCHLLTVAATTLTVLTASTAVAAPPTVTRVSVTTLGIPLTDVLVLGGTVAPGPDGAPALWVATAGKPAHLHAVTPLTGEVTASLELRNTAGGYAEGGYGVVATPNGDVYVGSYYDGRLYRRKAGTNSPLEDLGQAAPPSTYLWRLATDGGKVYGGTYSGGVVFEYDPTAGRFRSFGQLHPDVLYARSTAAANGIVYAGTQPDTHLYAITSATGSKRELPPPPGAAGTVNDLNVHAGLLYARIGPSITNATLHVLDLATEQWIAAVPGVAGLDVSAPGPDGRVYLTLTDGTKGELAAFDPRTRAVSRLGVGIPGRVSNSRGIGWAELGDPAWPGPTLVQMLWRGAVLLYNPATGRHTMVQSTVKGEPIGINSLGAGARHVYAGGYLNGGLAIIDTDTGERRFHRFAQIEAILEDTSGVWLGTYPDARGWAYDPAKPWSNQAYSPGPIGTEENPVLVTDGKAANQVRMPAVADAGDQVVFGSQGNTQLTGTLTLVAKSTRAATRIPGPITDQGTYVLAGHQKVVYGGTSIYGGYAVPEPTTRSGRLYAFDPATRQLLWSTEPRPGQPAVTGVSIDRENRLWALTNGTLTRHDPATGEVRQTLTLAPDAPSGRARGDLAYDSTTNTLWALVQQNQLWRIDARTGRAAKVVTRPMTRMTLHRSGDIYVAADAELLLVRTRRS